MKIDYVKLKNFMLYRKMNKSFVDKSIIGIICEYVHSKTKSNRGGKSTIPEAIKYCLFGSSRAKKEINLIHHGEDFMEVEVGLIDDDGNKYKIRRGRTAANKGLLECDWVDKKKEAQEAINGLLGCDKEEFDLTNFFKQSEINQFMNLGPNEKKEYFIRWFKNTHWMKLSEAVGIDLKEKNSKLSKLKTKKETLLEDLGDEETINKRIKKTKRQIKEDQDAYDKLVMKHHKLLKKVKSEDEVDELISQREEVETEIDEINGQIEDAVKAKKTFERRKRELADLRCDLKKVIPYSKQEYKQTINALNEVDANIDQTERLLMKIDDDFCGVCPVLEEGCDRIKKDPKQIKLMKKNLKIFNRVRQRTEKLIEELEGSKHIQEQVRDFKIMVKEAEKRLTPTKSPKKKVKSLQGKFEALTNDIEQAQQNDFDDKLEALTEKIEDKKSGLDILNQKIGKYHSQIVRFKKAQNKISKIDDKVSQLKVEIEDLKYLAFMFGKNGIPSQEIENAFQEIEDEINFILEKIGTTMQISFNADRELGTWEEECVGCGYRFPKGYRKKDCNECGEERQKKRKDELHLAVLENGNESTFEQESGGGKTFISLAVRIALTMLKQQQTGSNFKVLFLDEIDSALDDDSREQLMKLVTTVLMNHFGFQQIFWVSHDKKIKESVPHTLKVERHKEYAKARWV